LYFIRDIVGSAIHQDRQVSIAPEIFELYIDLMAQNKATEVHNFIKMNEGYRLEQTLEVWPDHMFYVLDSSQYNKIFSTFILLIVVKTITKSLKLLTKR